MDTTIDKHEQSVMKEKVGVNLKYKIMDKKVEFVATPLLEDNYYRMNEVVVDPSSQGGGPMTYKGFHWRNMREASRWLGDFLLSIEEAIVWKKLERQERALAFPHKKLGVLVQDS